MMESDERAKRLATAAGVSLDMSKTRFVMSKDTLVQLLNTVSVNEYVRGWNNQVCAGCRKKSEKDMQRPFAEPDKTYNFCGHCPKKVILMKKM